MEEWQRRAREDTLLYTIDNSLSAPFPLNNILLVKAVTETLNLCQDDVDLYNLDYAYPTDWITDKFSPEFVPYLENIIVVAEGEVFPPFSDGSKTIGFAQRPSPFRRHRGVWPRFGSF